jgi:hypothetical protein
MSDSPKRVGPAGTELMQQMPDFSPDSGDELAPPVPGYGMPPPEVMPPAPMPPVVPRTPPFAQPAPFAPRLPAPPRGSRRRSWWLIGIYAGIVLALLGGLVVALSLWALIP